MQLQTVKFIAKTSKCGDLAQEIGFSAPKYCAACCGLRQSLINAMDPRVPTHLRNLTEKTGCERRLITTHLDQSNYLPNLKQGEINKYDYTIEKCCYRVI
jgi:hypothetical protein